MKKKLFLVDDHPIFSLGMKELINNEPDLVICGNADGETLALDAIAMHEPDLVIVDITLKQGDGINLTKILKRLYPKMPILVLSMFDESLYAQRAIMAGARGYIMKQEVTEYVIEAIKTVLSGKIYVSETIKDAILQNLFNQAPTSSDPQISCLTGRELEVFRMIGQGLSTKEIADRLSLSIKTVGTYREHIKEKLNLRHASDLVRFATQFTMNR